MKKCNRVIKQIFKDHFEGFWSGNEIKYPEKMREHLYNEVQKMMNCSEFDLGFVAYICMICLEKIKIGFSCNSRFCNRCGKKYISDWVEKQVRRILDVPHRHCVFTVPKEFRKHFFWHRESLKDLEDMAYEVIEECKNRIDAKNRESYQKKKKRTHMKIEYGSLFKVYLDGFYVHARPRMRSIKGCARYIGRYLARPTVAEYRIESYDGNMVNFLFLIIINNG